jgi:hypothetical protein
VQKSADLHLLLCPSWFSILFYFRGYWLKYGIPAQGRLHDGVLNNPRDLPPPSKKRKTRKKKKKKEVKKPYLLVLEFSF